MSFAHVIKETLAGKSLSRILSDEEIGKIPAEGRLLDIGTSKGIYYHKYKNFSGTDIVSLNIDVGRGRPDVAADALALPFKDASFDVCMAHRVLEHIYDTRGVLKEVRRVLKPKGCFYAYLPFLHQYHSDPHDYHRYTDSALKKMLEEEGYEATVEAVGLGPFSSAYALVGSFFSRKVLRPLVPMQQAPRIQEVFRARLLHKSPRDQIK
jgi:SAM-dependent methyltransferase